MLFFKLTLLIQHKSKSKLHKKRNEIMKLIKKIEDNACCNYELSSIGHMCYGKKAYYYT